MHVVLAIIAILLFSLLIYAPGLWVNRVIRRYHQPADLFEGTGGELAEHLVKRLGLDGVGVEVCETGQDHYDPADRMIRLSPENHNGRSLSAITIAAHETGHAMQHHSGWPMFRLRTSLVVLARAAEKIGSAAIFATPLLGGLSRSAVVALVVFVLGISGIAFGTLVHIVTLPVEWNASFGRALPILTGSGYIRPEHEPHARKILKAAALTYVAGSLASLFNLYRWIAILRR